MSRSALHPALAAVFGLTLIACTPTVSPMPPVGDMCKHLVAVGCGHDVGACMTGLGSEVDGGRQEVNGVCILEAGSADAAAQCSGIGQCPP
jgi:hypothetical protein